MTLLITGVRRLVAQSTCRERRGSAFVDCTKKRTIYLIRFFPHIEYHMLTAENFGVTHPYPYI